MLNRIINAGGQLIAVSSQEPGDVARAKEQWGIRYPVVSDPALVIAKELHRRDLLTLYVDTEKYTTGDMKGHRTYAEGMIQPGLIALLPDWSKLYAWACIPDAHNMGGAVGRVKPEDFWRAISSSLAGDRSLVDWVPDDVRSSQEGASNIGKQILLRFIMLANGNFIRPLGLELPEEGSNPTFDGHVRGMMAKSLAKLAVMAMVLRSLSQKQPLVAQALMLAYVPYYVLRCEPVYRHSWHMAGNQGNNALLQLARL